MYWSSFRLDIRIHDHHVTGTFNTTLRPKQPLALFDLLSVWKPSKGSSTLWFTKAPNLRPELKPCDTTSSIGWVDLTRQRPCLSNWPQIEFLIYSKRLIDFFFFWIIFPHDLNAPLSLVDVNKRTVLNLQLCFHRSSGWADLTGEMLSGGRQLSCSWMMSEQILYLWEIRPEIQWKSRPHDSSLGLTFSNKAKPE